jgi:predicted HTH domain antitoxin
LKKWKVNRAVEIFGQGKVSVWKASAMADLSLREFIELLNGRRLDWVGIIPEDLESEVRSIAKETR